MRAPAVSGAQTYKELCLSARNEEKRLAEFCKRQQCIQLGVPKKSTDSGPTDNAKDNSTANQSGGPRRCYVCNKLGHMARSRRGDQRMNAKQVKSSQGKEDSSEPSDLLNMLYSSDDETEVGMHMVQVMDKGSQPQGVRVAQMVLLTAERI